MRDFEAGITGGQQLVELVDERPIYIVLFSMADDRAARLRAGEAYARISVEAERLGLASSAMTQAVDLPAIRERFRMLMDWPDHPQGAARRPPAARADPAADRPPPAGRGVPVRGVTSHGDRSVDAGGRGPTTPGGGSGSLGRSRAIAAQRPAVAVPRRPRPRRRPARPEPAAAGGRPEDATGSPRSRRGGVPAPPRTVHDGQSRRGGAVAGLRPAGSRRAAGRRGPARRPRRGQATARRAPGPPDRSHPVHHRHRAGRAAGRLARSGRGRGRRAALGRGTRRAGRRRRARHRGRAPPATRSGVPCRARQVDLDRTPRQGSRRAAAGIGVSAAAGHAAEFPLRDFAGGTRTIPPRPVTPLESTRS